MNYGKEISTVKGSNQQQNDMDKMESKAKEEEEKKDPDNNAIEGTTKNDPTSDTKPTEEGIVKARQLSGINRLVPPTDAERQDHVKASYNDKVGFDNDIVTMVANQTIAKLNTSTNILNLKNSPLSAYKFVKVDESAGASYGMSPFLITTEVPQLFKFKATYNEQQQVNPADIVTMKFSSTNVTEVVSKSIEIFNVSTMTVRVALNDTIAHMKIIDPNLTDDQSIKLQTLDRAARENPQGSVNAIESRIFSAITAFLALDNLLVAMPTKITTLEQVRGGLAANVLATMPFYDGMQPHLYYSVFSNLPDWFRKHLNDSFEECPLQIGDFVVNSYEGMKLAQFNKLVIDQYTAAVLRINFEKLRNHTLTTNVLVEKIMASMLSHDKVEVNTLADVQEFSLLYNWTTAEYNLYMFNIMTDTKMQEEVISFLRDELVKTNRLTSVNIEQVWRSLSATDTLALNFNSAWTASINIGDSFSLYEMVIYETFADWCIFELKFPNTPNSIEAITEVLNIHVFMILYPRITQRMIHTIGFRLKTLYEIMYQGTYRNFRNKYGEVRTEFGKKPFMVNSYEIKSAESQQGYVYSIFMPQVRDREPPPQILQPQETAQLNVFVTLLTNLRALVLPAIEPIPLDRKRIAKYPYMSTEYVAYGSWKPLTYADYQLSKITELGDKLSTLMTYADTMKQLFAAQNPSSNELPRTFNSYFTAWTTQISRLLSTAGPVYQITCANIQKSLFNSPFYVHSTFNPDPKQFFFVQRSVGIGPLVSANLSSVIVPKKILIPAFRLNGAMCLALTGEGEYIRNTLEAYQPAEDIQGSANRVRTNITVFNGVSCFMYANSLVAKSRKFGFAMQITQWLTTPGDAENPFRHLVAEIAQYMKMSTWTPLVKRIFETFGLNYETYFSGNIGASSTVLDGRFLDRTLVLIDPTTSMAIKNHPINTLFGQKFTYMVPLDIEKLSILTKPLVQSDSRIMRIKKDWYFGKLFVDELHPTQPALGMTNWVDETTINKDFSLTKIRLKGGQVTRLEYKSDKTGINHSMILPYTSNNVPILLIKMEYLTELPMIYLEVIAEAITEGKIILQIKELKVKVSIEDRPTRTTNYSEPNWSLAEVHDFLRNPSGCVIERTFVSTRSAINQQAQSLVRPGYIQWLATPTSTDPSLFVGTITNAIQRPEQTVIPTPDELGYGRGEHGLEFNSGVRKIDSNIINWNNSIPTVSPKLLNTIDVHMIPHIPQYLGVF